MSYRIDLLDDKKTWVYKRRGVFGVYRWMYISEDYTDCHERAMLDGFIVRWDSNTAKAARRGSRGLKHVYTVRGEWWAKLLYAVGIIETSNGTKVRVIRL